MQFQVPQFIEVESKIVGPLTIKQFFYLAGAFLLNFVFYFFLATWLWFIILLLTSGLAIAFAFVKINGRPFSIFIGALVGYFLRPRFYLWQKAGIKPPSQELSSLELKLKTSSQPIPKRERWFRPKGDLFEVFRKTTGERDVARRVDYR